MTTREVYTFGGSLLITFFLTRFFLYLFPDVNLNIGKYNIHHLFVGVVLLIIVIVLLVVGIKTKSVFVIGGVGAALALDQIVFLITTDGGDITYLGNISFWGAIVSVAITLFVLGGLYYYEKNISRR